MKKILLLLIIIFSTSLGLWAQQSFKLKFPVKCTFNKDCWIVNYVDDDSTSNWHDYKSGRQTYNGHTGVDIAIKNISKMKEGVDVLAAENGFVIATRDGVQDKNALTQDLNSLQNIGCGNRVAIKHSDGYITDYCHMKQGSIKVKKGDSVLAGQKLGQIGLSGLTEFPHMHMNVQQNNKFIDPFTGLERYTKGSKNSLWETMPAYKPHIVYNVGVSSEIPTLIDIRNEKYKSNRVPSDSNAIIIWLDMFHVEAGDYIDISAKTANNISLINQKIMIDTPNAKKLLYVGKKKPKDGFKKGNYNVQISFKRPNTNISDNESFIFTVY